MIDLNEENYEAETKSGLVLVDYWSPQCAPCRMIMPNLQALQNVKVAKVNTFDPDGLSLAVNANVSALPTLVFMKDGVEVARMQGMQSKETLQKKVDELNG